MVAAQVGAQVRHGQDEVTGLAYWHYTGDGISFKLVQRLPDQTRAFFLARGFGPGEADEIARSCVFQTIFRNTDGPGFRGAIDYDLSDWRIRRAGSWQPLRLKEAWDRQWEARGIAQAPRIAFRWSLLPTRQRFDPGDYNWGMSVYGLPPGSVFDLRLRWVRDSRPYTVVLEDIECPPEQ